MLKDKEIWLDDQKRNEELNRAADSAQQTYFGYQKVAAEEKADRVLNHFNSIARHYQWLKATLHYLLVSW